MKKSITIFFTMLALAFSVFGQTTINQLKVGEKMPKKIDSGNYTELEYADCSCRVFTITSDTPLEEQNKGGELSETIGIHYNNDTIVGIIKITVRLDNENALKTYITKLSEYLRLQTHSKDRKFIKIRDGSEGVLDGVFYFTYSYDGGRKYRNTGVIKNSIIEESYIPESSYKPKLSN